ncbi:MAG: right-handed parallel beta-helix repeat-containing protein [Acidimicrobiales bacterium]
MHRGKLLFVAPALAIVTGIVPGITSSASAEETPVTCNMPVSGTIKVANDLVCLDTDGLIVASDSTVIDLNGHRITCIGSGYVGSCQGIAPLGGLSDQDPDSGIDIDGRKNVRVFSSVPGGTIGGFDNQVDISNSDGVKVEQLVLTGPPNQGPANPRPASHGVLIRGATCGGGTIYVGGGNSNGNDISGSNQGVAINGDCVTVVQNMIHDNNSHAGVRTGVPVIPPSNGILVNQGQFNDLNGNAVFNNGDNDETIDSGIRVRVNSSENHIRNNIVTDNLGDGILMENGANSNKIDNNTMVGNGAALSGTTFYDAAGRNAPGGPPGSQPLNVWNQNNMCVTQNQEVPPGTCGAGEVTL